jgi:hypothetical protein
LLPESRNTAGKKMPSSAQISPVTLSVNPQRLASVPTPACDLATQITSTLPKFQQHFLIHWRQVPARPEKYT